MKGATRGYGARHKGANSQLLFCGLAGDASGERLTAVLKECADLSAECAALGSNAGSYLTAGKIFAAA